MRCEGDLDVGFLQKEIQFSFSNNNTFWFVNVDRSSMNFEQRLAGGVY